jgi:membrane protein
MVVQPLLKGDSAIQNISRWVIPAVYVVCAVLSFLSFDRWFDDIFRNIAPALDLILAISFLAVLLSSSDRLIRNAMSLISGGLILSLAQFFFLKGSGVLMLLSYNGTFNFVVNLLILAGVITLISDSTIRTKAPRLSLAYVFFIAAGTVLSAVRYIIGFSPDMIWLWDTSYPFHFLTSGFWIVQQVLAALFWFFIFKGPLNETQIVQTNPLKIFAVPATIVVTILASVLLIIC